jgi:DNA-directed RNA polymerase subunit RPC12/RpoP
MKCPHCGAVFYAASAWSGPEPECEPGVLCPECGEFISDEELDEDEEGES